jgi:hypothetical protein
MPCSGDHLLGNQSRSGCTCSSPSAPSPLPLRAESRERGKKRGGKKEKRVSDTNAHFMKK